MSSETSVSGGLWLQAATPTIPRAALRLRMKVRMGPLSFSLPDARPCGLIYSGDVVSFPHRTPAGGGTADGEHLLTVPIPGPIQPGGLGVNHGSGDDSCLGLRGRCWTAQRGEPKAKSSARE